jgi:hypothetical protein
MPEPERQPVAGLTRANLAAALVEVGMQLLVCGVYMHVRLRMTSGLVLVARIGFRHEAIAR